MLFLFFFFFFYKTGSFSYLPPLRSSLLFSEVRTLGLYLFKVDRLSKDMCYIFLLQLVQSGALQHESRSQLHLHHSLVYLHLHDTK